MAILVVFGVGSLAAQNEETGAAGQRKDPKVVAEKMVAGWERELEAEEELARIGGDSREFVSRAGNLVFQVLEHVATGHEKLVARVLRLSALAKLGTGDKAAALWSIESARIFSPRVAEDLNGFGVSGKRLAKLLAGEADLAKNAKKVRPGQFDVVPPRPVAAIRLRYPRPARAVKLEGTVSLQVVIDAEGEPHCPEILEQSTGEHATALIVAALRALRDVRFMPVKKHREPVPSIYAVTLRFRKP